MPSALTPERFSFDKIKLSKLQTFNLPVSGLERQFSIYVPENAGSKNYRAMVFLLHGGGGMGRHMFRLTEFGRIAERENFIVVVPDGYEGHWNDGRAERHHKTHQEGIDDIDFIVSLTRLIRSHFDVAGKNFAAGFSNGGMMCFRLALALPEEINAIATICSSMPAQLFESAVALAGKPASLFPVSILMMASTTDPVLPFKGGKIVMDGKVFAQVMPVETVVDFWLGVNGGSGKSNVQKLYLKQEQVTVTWSCYKGQADLELFVLDGCGHVWPGPSRLGQYMPVACIGKICKGFDASEMIWKFFSRHLFS